MTQELTNEEYYGELKLMFQTKGWKYLQLDIQQNAQVINNLQATKDADDLQFRKGQLAVLGYLINLEDTLKYSEEQDAQAVSNEGA